MAEDTSTPVQPAESPLPPAILRSLGDRSYDKRKNAALEIEALIKVLYRADTSTRTHTRTHACPDSRPRPSYGPSHDRAWRVAILTRPVPLLESGLAGEQ